MRTFIMGDIHGYLDKLKSVLKVANFDYENDRLIQLGDIIDRGPNSYECIEELLKIKNLISIKGNHDDCWFEYLKGNKEILWEQGASSTYMSYEKAGVKPKVHFDFFSNQKIYYFEDNILFVHGGFNRHENINAQSKQVLIWDRDLWLAALSYKAMKDHKYPFKMKDNFDHVYIGHTPTIFWDSTVPMTCANITNLDTGAGMGKEGRLTIMDLETKEFWQNE